ncbi:MAG: NADH-quinone oxidoreductase subunit L, partial [Flavobacteriales bacterium]|nr:NADH-quinone oxidoreductase subunit L [Flavobacteriales bacterium]
MSTDLLAALVPALPLVGAVILAALRRKLSANVAGGLATTLIAGSFVASVLLFMGFDPTSGGRTVKLLDWIDVGGMQIPLALRIDALSLTMMLIVTGIGSLIHLYSIGYMHEDERAPTFFAQLNLFSFAMLMLVMGSNFLITFIGWEGVGL